MSQPIYFLPHLRKEAADDVAKRKLVLKERGLFEVFADVPMVEQPLQELPGRGPNNLPGCLLCYQTNNEQMPRRWGYFPAEQSWTPVGDGSLLWIGVDSAELPAPDDLQRKRKHGGYWIELGDGNRWLVPVIRRPDDSTELPSDMVLDAAGRLLKPIKAAYRSYWDETLDSARYFYESAQLDEGRALSLAVRALSLNYRYDMNVHNVLRAIDSENWAMVLGCTVDLPKADEIADAQKKMNDPSLAASITHGQPDDSAGIDQPGATSI